MQEEKIKCTIQVFNFSFLLELFFRSRPILFPLLARFSCLPLALNEWRTHTFKRTLVQNKRTHTHTRRVWLAFFVPAREVEFYAELQNIFGGIIQRGFFLSLFSVMHLPLMVLGSRERKRWNEWIVGKGYCEKRIVMPYNLCLSKLIRIF